MKVTAKIIILVIAITIAIGGVMIYAKTKVEPPVATKPIDQFSHNIEMCFKSFATANESMQQDSIMQTTLNKINIYVAESKIDLQKGDSDIDKLLSLYSRLFVKRSLAKFSQSVWHDADHTAMLSVISRLRQIKHSDNTVALAKTTADSLSQIENVISKYKQARAICRRTSFSGISNARSTISQARQFAKDPYLSHCTDLISALGSVKSNIAASHYNYVCGMVAKLAQFKSYSQSYYNNTLVPQVEEAITHYDDNAKSLYGTKRNVEDLWNRSRVYYSNALEYYNNY